MDQGFVPEAKDHSKVEMWVEGAPQKKWWGLSYKVSRPLEIETWRCARYAYLEIDARG